jgi:hypothetical protein
MKSLVGAKEEHLRLERYVGEQVRKLSQENEALVRNLLDLVGEKVGKEV